MLKSFKIYNNINIFNGVKCVNITIVFWSWMFLVSCKVSKTFTKTVSHDPKVKLS